MKIMLIIYFDIEINKSYICIMFKKKSFWIFLLIFLGIIAYYFFLNPAQETQYFLPCFFYEITGYKCPGCGTQRAFHELLHFHFLAAMKQNLLFVLGIPYFLGAVFFNVKKDKFPKMNEFFTGNKTLLLLLIIAIVFGILRNF